MPKDYCVKPCSECPFPNKSLRGWLGEFTVEETIGAALSEGNFDCHLTREGDEASRRHCAGRMLLASKSAKRFRDPEKEQIRLKLKDLNPNFQDEILSAKEFIKHHKR